MKFIFEKNGTKKKKKRNKWKQPTNNKNKRIGRKWRRRNDKMKWKNETNSLIKRSETAINHIRQEIE